MFPCERLNHTALLYAALYHPYLFLILEVRQLLLNRVKNLECAKQWGCRGGKEEGTALLRDKQIVTALVERTS